MTIKIGSLTLTVADPKYGHEVYTEATEPIEVTNTAINGTVYNYVHGTVTRITIQLNWLTEAQKDQIEGMRGTDQTFQINSETAKTVRIINTTNWKRERVKGSYVYSGKVTMVVVS